MTRKNKTRILKASGVCMGLGVLSIITTLAVGLPFKFNGQNRKDQILAESEFDAESQKYVIEQVDEYEHAKQMEHVGSEIVGWGSVAASSMALATAVLNFVYINTSDENDKEKSKN